MRRERDRQRREVGLSAKAQSQPSSDRHLRRESRKGDTDLDGFEQRVDDAFAEELAQSALEPDPRRDRPERAFEADPTVAVPFPAPRSVRRRWRRRWWLWALQGQIKEGHDAGRI